MINLIRTNSDNPDFIELVVLLDMDLAITVACSFLHEGETSAITGQMIET